MTATDNPEQIAAAAAAVQLGEQIALEYREAAGRTPGAGLAVALPSIPDNQGRRPQGLNFDLDPAIPALRQPEKPLQLTPSYASEVVGGMLHHASQPGTPAGLDGVAWPSGQAQPSSAYGRSLVFVPASSQPTWRSRLREAWAALLGR